MARYLAARTAFFDRLVVTTLDRGMPEVVVAAAGYDGRSLRYAKPGVRWFELDHPDTQQDKRRRLHRLGIDAAHVGFVPADFITDEVAPLLIAAGLDPGWPSASRSRPPRRSRTPGEPISGQLSRHSGNPSGRS